MMLCDTMHAIHYTPPFIKGKYTNQKIKLTQKKKNEGVKEVQFRLVYLANSEDSDVIYPSSTSVAVEENTEIAEPVNTEAVQTETDPSNTS